MGSTEVLVTTWIVLAHLTISKTPGGAKSTSPMHVCLVASKVVAEGGARLLCMSIPRKPKGRQTFMGGPREPRLDDTWQNLVRRCGRMGRTEEGVSARLDQLLKVGRTLNNYPMTLGPG